jgi:hypothetical protein
VKVKQLMFNLKVYTMKRQRFFEGLGLKVYVTLAICMALLLNVQFLNAQSSTINVKGVVNDAMGPVIGASVVEKGNATNGTITDIDGNFSLKVPSDATLTISFIGYKTVELPVAGKTSFTVTLKEDSEMLDEVVVAVREREAALGRGGEQDDRTRARDEAHAQDADGRLHEANHVEDGETGVHVAARGIDEHVEIGRAHV